EGRESGADLLGLVLVVLEFLLPLLELFERQPRVVREVVDVVVRPLAVEVERVAGLETPLAAIAKLSACLVAIERCAAIDKRSLDTTDEHEIGRVVASGE